ncbi:IS200/IS605 family element transposase accessory protein TnpB [Candidatus Poribacteria bacterium]|nr:IS200/IS605 family element transposase accessory protein TnpB [Candidatus Poribacteria bacterium]
MEVTISCKFRLHTTKEQHSLIMQTAKAYRSAFNFVSTDHLGNKSSNVRVIHNQYYQTIRSQFQLPSQLACNVERDVARNYLSKWDYCKENHVAFETAPQQKSLTTPYTLNRTFSIKPDKLRVSLTTLNGRQGDIPISGWNKHYEYIRTGKLGDPKLVYNHRRKFFFVFIPVTMNVPELKPQEVVGIDTGQKHIAAIASTTGQKYLVDVKENTKQRKTHYHEVRGQLMKKGTRSAKRRLSYIADREKRFVSDVLHSLSGRIILTHTALFGLEDLTDIRENTNTRRKDKEARRQVEQWPFREFQFDMEYKSALYHGIKVVYVDPAYTSKTCPVCGHRDKANRPNNGEQFDCQNCHFKEHADIVGAINIAIRCLVHAQNINSWALVSGPHAPKVEQALPLQGVGY